MVHFRPDSIQYHYFDIGVSVGNLFCELSV